MLLQNIPQLSKLQVALSKLFHWTIFLKKELLSASSQKGFNMPVGSYENYVPANIYFKAIIETLEKVVKHNES